MEFLLFQSQNKKNSNGPRKLSVFFQNVNGLRSKLEMLRQSLSHSVYDLVVVLMESNLTEDINSVELGFFNYRVYRSDRSIISRQKTSGSGVIVAIRDGFES